MKGSLTMPPESITPVSAAPTDPTLVGSPEASSLDPSLMMNVVLQSVVTSLIMDNATESLSHDDDSEISEDVM